VLLMKQKRYGVVQIVAGRGGRSRAARCAAPEKHGKRARISDPLSVVRNDAASGAIYQGCGAEGITPQSKRN
jgi:hypothetical protein